LSDAGIVVGNESMIGDGCVIAANVTMAKTKVGRPGRPIIGDRVIIGPGAAFVGGVRVGDDAVIGPNVVVFADVPQGATVLTRPGILSEDAAPPPPQSLEGLRALKRDDVPSTTRVGRGVLVAAAGLPQIDGAVTIGDGCLIHERVAIGWDVRQERASSRGRTRIGDRVVLSPGAVILRGVTVGDGAFVGPNVVVDGDVPPGGRITSAPARVFGGLRSGRVGEDPSPA
jgi:serine acetyltransferase